MSLSSLVYKTHYLLTKFIGCTIYFMIWGFIEGYVFIVAMIYNDKQESLSSLTLYQIGTTFITGIIYQAGTTFITSKSYFYH